MAQYDLTQTLIPYLDRHLALPLLNHLTELDPPVFDLNQVQKAQYDLAKGTNMIDYAEQLGQQVKAAGGQVDDIDFESLRKQAMEKTSSLQASVAPVLRVIEDPAVVDRLKGAVDKLRNMDLLEKEYGLTLDQVNALYHYGHYQYTYGDYPGAASFLYHFLILSPSVDLNLSAHWGKLLSNILCTEWDAALAEVKDLKEIIDNPQTQESAKPSNQLQARSWLLHWGLFVFFNHEQGRTALLDIFLSPAYLNTLQTQCPHLARYLVAASILTHRTLSQSVKITLGGRTMRSPIQEITKILLMEQHHYSDPITEFLTCLYGEFDFEKAQEKLAVAKGVVEQDWFLEGFVDEFMEGARWLVSEVYCKIHRRIDITDLSARLNLSKEEGEKWIVNLIRDSKMGIDAKIDLQANMIHITRPHPTPTQNLIETTRGLAFRSQAVQYAMQRKAQGEGAEQRERGQGGQRGANRGGRGRPQEA